MASVSSSNREIVTVIHHVILED